MTYTFLKYYSSAFPFRSTGFHLSLCTLSASSGTSAFTQNNVGSDLVIATIIDMTVTTTDAMTIRGIWLLVIVGSIQARITHNIIIFISPPNECRCAFALCTLGTYTKRHISYQEHNIKLHIIPR